MERYLLCRPVGGLNDMLCQIERCCHYAERHDRVVVVDTNYPHANHFRDRLDRYFDSRQRRLILCADGLLEELDRGDVHPAPLKGRLASYTPRYDHTSRLHFDRESGVSLGFDFKQDHPCDVLVHHQLGGGFSSALLMLRLCLTPALSVELRRRWERIGLDYTAIHVRHTDYRTDYADSITMLQRAPDERLFLATDNRNVLEEFSDALGQERVFSFASLDYPPGVPLHHLQLDEIGTFERNRDSILDVLMLALARRLHILRLANKSTGTHSGFSTLARSLHDNKVILHHVLGAPALRFGLD